MKAELNLNESQIQRALDLYIQGAIDALIKPEKATSLRKNGGYTPNPGVYTVFRGNELIYVGESGSLSERAGDMFRTVHHQFRRELGREQFSSHSLFKPASSKKPFPAEIELLLTEYMEQNLKIAMWPVVLGRKEIEERIVKEYRPKFNNRGKRGG